MTKKLTTQEEQAILNHLITEARDNFPAFLALIHPPDHSSYTISKMHWFLAGKINEIAASKKGKRIALSCPPQVGKTSEVSVLAVAWALGKFPGIRIASTGFSFSVLTGALSEVRSIIASPIYQAIFPDAKPERNHNRNDSVQLENGSHVMVKASGSKLTGHRVDWLIIDDPHAGRAEAESQTQRDNVVRWYYGDCLSRLSPNAKVFIIATRWHPSDLTGSLTDPDKVAELKAAGAEDSIYEYINIPALCEDEENDPLGRKLGESCFPEVRPTEFFEAVRAETPKYEWDSQYRGMPRASASGQVDISKIVYVDMYEVPTDIQWLRGWDLALTEKQTSDFSAGALCAYDKRTELFYLIDVEKHKLSWMKMKSRFIDITLDDLAKYNCGRVGLEAVSGFEIGLQELRKELSGKVAIEKHNPTRGGKLMRAQPWLNILEAGRLRIVRAKWNRDFINCLDSFPDVEHDDMIDATSVAREALMPAGGRLLFA